MCNYGSTYGSCVNVRACAPRCFSPKINLSNRHRVTITPVANIYTSTEIAFTCLLQSVRLCVWPSAAPPCGATTQGAHMYASGNQQTSRSLPNKRLAVMGHTSEQGEPHLRGTPQWCLELVHNYNITMMTVNERMFFFFLR